MSTAAVTEALHPQDRLLIVEALAYWASGHGSCSRPADTADRRKHRAAALAEHLLAAEGIDGSVRDAIDTEWDGSERDEGETDERGGDDTERRPFVVAGSGSGESDEADA